MRRENIAKIVKAKDNNSNPNFTIIFLIDTTPSFHISNEVANFLQRWDQQAWIKYVLLSWVVTFSSKNNGTHQVVALKSDTKYITLYMTIMKKALKGFVWLATFATN